MRLWLLCLAVLAACGSSSETSGSAASGASLTGGVDGSVAGNDGSVLDRPDGEAADTAVAADAGTVEADVPPEPACPSGVKWTWGNEGSPEMHPGGTCVSCHKSDWEAPKLLFGGTVFTGYHTEDDCNSQATDAGPVTVEITGADGKVLTAKVNAAGNFYLKTGKNTLAMPYKARVIRGDKVNEMFGEQTNGDCNSCHTQQGSNGAPGRIVAP